jgi:hypothetical protein
MRYLKSKSFSYNQKFTHESDNARDESRSSFREIKIFIRYLNVAFTNKTEKLII